MTIKFFYKKGCFFGGSKSNYRILENIKKMIISKEKFLIYFEKGDFTFFPVEFIEKWEILKNE